MAVSLKIALANVLLAIAFGLFSAALIRGSARRPSAALFFPIGAWILISVVSALFSDDPHRSFVDLKDLLTLALAPMIISLLDDRRWDRLLMLLAAVLTLSATVGIVEYIRSAGSLSHRLNGLANHYMTYAGWTLVVTLLLVGDAVFSRDRRRLLWTAPAAVLGALTLLLGLTRGAWIGLAAGLILAAALVRPRVLLLLPMAVTLLLLAAPQSVLSRAVATSDLDHPATRERLGMISTGLAMVRDHPILGVGPGMVQPAYTEYRRNGAPQRIPHLHNNIIQIAAERGLMGLAAYLAILGTFVIHIRHALKTSGENARPALVGCLLAVVGVTAAGLFEYNWGDAEVWIVTLASLSAPFALAPREAR